MNAVVVAGGAPEPSEPLYAYTQGKPKALLDMAGKPMVQWVLDALSQATLVEQVVLVGLDEASGLTCAKPITFLPDQGDMFSNLKVAAVKMAELDPTTRCVLSLSGDIPAITAEMVDWAVRTVQETEHDIYYLVVTRQVMEARFPNSRRSFYRLKTVDVCGADMHAFDIRVPATNQEIWTKLIDARKNAFRQASILGIEILLLFLLRQLDIEGAVRRICRRLDLNGRAIFCPYAEAGMDADKPYQVEILRADLARRKVT